MPQLSEIIGNRKSTFKKKNYRPWDLSGNWESASTSNSPSPETPADKADELIPIAQLDSQSDQPQQESSQVIKLKTGIANPSSDTTSLPELDNINIDNNKITIREPLENIKATNGERSDNKEITKREPLENIKITKRQQLDNELDNNSSDLATAIKRLSGHQEAIFYYLLGLCCERNDIDTGALNTYQLAEFANCSYLTIKMCLKRLIDKKLLIRKPGKRAKGGFVEFEITKDIQIIALNIRKPTPHNSKTDIDTLTNKVASSDPELDNKLDNNSPSSSSYIYNTTTTMPPEWVGINFDQLKEIGFSTLQLMQLYEKRLNTPAIIQESINHFAYALKNNPKKINAYSDPLNVFMGVLRKGQSWVENNYEPPHVQTMRELLARKKAEKEQENTLEKELIDLYFQDWKAKLSAEQKNLILPKKVIGPEDAYYKTHFIENIWPSTRAQLVVEK